MSRREVEGYGQRGNGPKSSQGFSEIFRMRFLIQNGQESGEKCREVLRTVPPISITPLHLCKPGPFHTKKVDGGESMMGTNLLPTEAAGHNAVDRAEKSLVFQ